MSNDTHDISEQNAANPEETVPAAAPVPVRPARVRAKAAVPVPPITPAVRAPFRMSYDGTTDKDYIAHIIRLGAR